MRMDNPIAKKHTYTQTHTHTHTHHSNAPEPGFTNQSLHLLSGINMIKLPGAIFGEERIRRALKGKGLIVNNMPMHHIHFVISHCVEVVENHIEGLCMRMYANICVCECVCTCVCVFMSMQTKQQQSTYT